MWLQNLNFALIDLNRSAPTSTPSVVELKFPWISLYFQEFFAGKFLFFFSAQKSLSYYVVGNYCTDRFQKYYSTEDQPVAVQMNHFVLLVSGCYARIENNRGSTLVCCLFIRIKTTNGKNTFRERFEAIDSQWCVHGTIVCMWTRGSTE